MPERDAELRLGGQRGGAASDDGGEPPRLLIRGEAAELLQARTFHQIGATVSGRFEGKLIAITNRDLPAEIAAGRFRKDFYYRL